MASRIFVTGLGVVTPYGIGIDPLQQGLAARRSILAALTEPDCTTWPVKVGGWVPELRPEELGLFHNKLRGMGKYVKIGLLAARQALASAGLGEGDPDRIGAFIASGTFGHNAEGLFRAFGESLGADGRLDLAGLGKNGIDNIHPWWLLSTISNNLIFFVTHFLNVKGANTNYCNSAVAGAYALDRALESLRRGEVEVALVGGADCPVNWQMLSDLSTMGFLAEGPSEAVLPARPFRPESGGAILADAAAYLVLENEERVQARGATPLAEIRGLALHASLAEDLHPPASGVETRRIVESLLKQVPAGETVAVNAAAVGLPAWDAAERRGLEEALAGRPAWVHAAKPWVGHTYSASFILETVVSLLEMRSRSGLPFPAGAVAAEGPLAGPPADPGRAWEINLGQCFGGNTAGVLLHVV